MDYRSNLGTTITENNHIVFRMSSNMAIFFLLSFPHYKTPYCDAVPFLDLLFNALKVISVLFILLIIIQNNHKINTITWLVLIYQIVLLFNTVVQAGDLRRIMTETVSIIGVMLLWDFMVQNDVNAFLESQMMCFEIIIYLNFLTELFFPKGIYVWVSGSGFQSGKCWILGYYNQHTKFFIPAILITLLYSYITKRYLRTIILIVTMYASVFVVWSGGGILSMTAMIVAFILFRNARIINYWVAWIIQIAFLIVISIFGSIESMILNASVLIRKENSFIARVALWRKTWNLILKNWMFGYGKQTELDRRIAVNGLSWELYAHNLALEILYIGGVVLMIIFIIMVVHCGKILNQYKSDEISHIFAIAFLGWGMQSLTDAYTTPLLFGMFVVAAGCGVFVCEKRIAEVESYVQRVET